MGARNRSASCAGSPKYFVWNNEFTRPGAVMKARDSWFVNSTMPTACTRLQARGRQRPSRQNGSSAGLASRTLSATGSARLGIQALASKHLPQPAAIGIKPFQLTRGRRFHAPARSLPCAECGVELTPFSRKTSETDQPGSASMSTLTTWFLKMRYPQSCTEGALRISHSSLALWLGPTSKSEED